VDHPRHPCRADRRRQHPPDRRRPPRRRRRKRRRRDHRFPIVRGGAGDDERVGGELRDTSSPQQTTCRHAQPSLDVASRGHARQPQKNTTLRSRPTRTENVPSGAPPRRRRISWIEPDPFRRSSPRRRRAAAGTRPSGSLARSLVWRRVDWVGWKEEQTGTGEPWGGRCPNDSATLSDAVVAGRPPEPCKTCGQ
jgi:hypothetical protein